MADRRFDAVVIGGGHHGTIIACYLARAGLGVGLFERGAQLGGGATSNAGPAPGFVMNRFAHWTRFHHHPAYRDFDLRARGLRYVFPDQNQGIGFEDGSAFIGYSAFTIEDATTGRLALAQDNVDRTRAQIRRFSPRDADTYVDLLDKYTRYWKPAFDRYRFLSPPPWGVPDPLEALVGRPETGIEPVHQFMTARQLAGDFFESPELQTLFLRAVAISTGCFPDDVIGLQGLIHMIPSALAFEAPAVAVGGSQSISDALVAAGRALGVEYVCEAEVDEILASGPRATGIRLCRGDVIAADIVVSAVGLPQSILRMMRNVAIDARLARRLRNIQYDRGQLFSASIALHEPPRYRAARGDAELGPQARLLWGPRDPDYLATRYPAEIMLHGHATRLYAYSSVDTQWDPSRAPEGKHLAACHEFGAPRRLFTPPQWQDIKARFQAALLAQWRHHAPNMTPDNIIAVEVTGPDDVEASLPDMIEGGFSEGAMIASQLGRFRPIPELSGYRTVLSNVYACSSNQHPGPGIGRGSSYNCFRQITTDLDLH